MTSRRCFRERFTPKAFLRNYAIYLGLDPSHVLSLYHRQYQDEEDEQVVVPQPNIRPRGTSQLITGGTVAGLVLVVVLAIFVLYLSRQIQTFKQETASTAASIVSTPTPIPPTPTAVPSTAAVVAPRCSPRSRPHQPRLSWPTRLN